MSVSNQALHASHNIHWLTLEATWACLACGKVARQKAIKLSQPCCPGTGGARLCKKLGVPHQPPNSRALPGRTNGSQQEWQGGMETARGVNSRKRKNSEAQRVSDGDASATEPTPPQEGTKVAVSPQESQGSSPAQSQGKLEGAEATTDDQPGGKRKSVATAPWEAASAKVKRGEPGDRTEPGSTAPTTASEPLGDDELAQKVNACLRHHWHKNKQRLEDAAVRAHIAEVAQQGSKRRCSSADDRKAALRQRVRMRAASGGPGH